MASRPPAVARVLERVTGTVRRHGLIPEGSKLVLAVSGGADSLSLLHTMSRLRRLLRVRLSVVHVDHAVREASAADARYVERVADRLGVARATYRVEGLPPRGSSPEAWLRTQRYRLFEHARLDARADLVATAHTSDDVAETVLIGLVRGGGLDALAGIPPARDRFVRPLLEVSRAETAAFCRALRLRPREDPMNADPRYLRAAVRHQVIPAMERATGREVRATIARTASAVRRDAEFLDALAREAEASVLAPEDGGPGEVRLRATALRALPDPVASRVVLRALRALDVAAESAHVAAVLDLASGRPGRRADLPGPLLATRDRTYVRVSLLPSRSTSP